MTTDFQNSSGAKINSSYMLQFSREWLKQPFRTGAITPSSKNLAHAITKGLTKKNGPILELGAGTGVFTSALIANGVRPQDITAVEANGRFADLLKEEFPTLGLTHGNAARVHKLTNRTYGAAICGLPLLSMPNAVVLKILKNSFNLLKPNAELRLFTYGCRCPVPRTIRTRLSLSTHRVAFVSLNFPPASVYTLTQKDCAG